jgi:hypothetical protein
MRQDRAAPDLNPTPNPMAKPQSTNLLAAMDKLQQNRSRKTPAKKVSPPALQVSLQPWPEAVRGIPNVVLRGALFGVTQRRVWVKDELICSTVETEIYFTGERFNQTDLDLFETILHLGRHQLFGERIEFTTYAMLKALGRHNGKTQRLQLRKELVRLRAGTVDMRWTKTGKSFVGGMLANVAIDEKTGRHSVLLDKKMLQLYDAGYTLINWGQRQALGTSLAKWLQNYYVSHAAPYPNKVETIKNLCGSTVERLGDFRKLLRAALAELEAVDVLKGHITEDDLVVIEKVPTPSQQRHLDRLK